MKPPMTPLEKQVIKYLWPDSTHLRYEDLNEPSKVRVDELVALIASNVVEATFIEPGEVIPYTTIKGVDYVTLEWLMKKFQSAQLTQELKGR